MLSANQVPLLVEVKYLVDDNDFRMFYCVVCTEFCKIPLCDESLDYRFFDHLEDALKRKHVLENEWKDVHVEISQKRYLSPVQHRGTFYSASAFVRDENGMWRDVTKRDHYSAHRSENWFNR